MPLFGFFGFGVLQPSTWGRSSTRLHRVILPLPPSLAVFWPDRTRAFFSWSFCFLFFFGFPIFCFLCIIFVLIFLCILFSLGFPIFALVFPYIVHLCLFCVFFGFYSSADLLHACFATLFPLLGLFPCPHRIELPTRPSVYEVCLYDWFYFPVFYWFFACNKSYLDWPVLGCDAGSRSLSCGCEHYPGFRVDEDKCWPGVLSPQCQGIIAISALVSYVWYRSVFHLLISHRLTDMFWESKL